MRCVIRYITVEGNIGAGKTTLLEPLAAALDAIAVHEGVEEDKYFQQLVADIGAGKKGAGETLNLYLANKRAETINGFEKGKLYLMERSIVSSFLFALADNSSDRTLNEIGKHTIKSQPPALSLYYRTPAHICMKRLRKRGRAGEEGLTMRYLLRVEKQHDEWASVGEELHRVITVEDDEMSVGQIAKLINMKLDIVKELSSIYEKQQARRNA